ncbi:MAG: hypothetical protein M1819_001060 [Sarea resinae]|nr:MAG: hypothetical protein M1819_001060 [Sarea resinae]
MAQHLEGVNMELNRVGPSDNDSFRDPDAEAQGPEATSTDNVAHQLLPITRKRQIAVLTTSFLTICITIGLNQSYGVFQSYYVSDDKRSILPPSQRENGALVAFVGSLGSGLTWGGSIAVNPLMARVKDTRYITVLGVIFMSLGLGLASLATQVRSAYKAKTIWHLLLTQGLLYGIGSSMLYFPILSVAPEYFDAHRGSAMGFVLSGAGVGGLVLSPATRALIGRVSIRWTLRVLSLVVFGIAMPIALTAAPSRFNTSRASRRPTHVNISIARKPAFFLSVLAAFLQGSGNLVPLTFLSEYSVSLGYTASFGAVLLALNNGINAASRILTGYVADRLCGRQNTLIFTVIGSAVAVVALWLGSVVALGAGAGKLLWLLFVIFYGVCAGGYNALFPTTVAEVFGLQAYAAVNGFIYSVRGMGAVFGSPVGGLILGDADAAPKTGGGGLAPYKGLVLFDAALLFGAAGCVMGVRWFDAVEKRAWRWRA